MSRLTFFNPKRDRWDVTPVASAAAELLNRHTEARDTVIEAARELMLTLGDGEDHAAALATLERAVADFDNFKRTWEG